MSGCPASIKNITVNRLAQEIVFINKRPTGYRSNCAGADLEKTTVEICEVKVMGKISSNNLTQHTQCTITCNTINSYVML